MFLFCSFVVTTVECLSYTNLICSVNTLIALFREVSAQHNHEKPNWSQRLTNDDYNNRMNRRWTKDRAQSVLNYIYMKMLLNVDALGKWNWKYGMLFIYSNVNDSGWTWTGITQRHNNNNNGNNNTEYIKLTIKLPISYINCFIIIYICLARIKLRNIVLRPTRSYRYRSQQMQNVFDAIMINLRWSLQLFLISWDRHCAVAVQNGRIFCVVRKTMNTANGR